MGTAKVISLTATPFQVSHLCFEVDGILEDLNTHLGAKVSEFKLKDFYARLNSFPTVAGDPSRLLYGPSEIQASISMFNLARLRAEARKAALNKAINARQNAYYAKYGNAS